MPSARQLCAFAAVGFAGFAAGVFVSGPRTAAEDLPAPRAVVREDPPNRSLDANLWMQISAEYRACCYQAYNLGRRRNRPDPGHEATAGDRGKASGRRDEPRAGRPARRAAYAAPAPGARPARVFRARARGRPPARRGPLRPASGGRSLVPCHRLVARSR